MSGGRIPLFVTQTPFPGLSNVTLFADTWHDHIVKGHPDMHGKVDLVRTTVSSPDVVAIGTANPDYRVFVNRAGTTSGSSPLVVIVDPEQQLICTAYYNRTFKVIQSDQVVWLPSEIK